MLTLSLIFDLFSTQEACFALMIVMQAITKHVAPGLPLELLYADDLVVVAENENKLRMKMANWKEAIEWKGLKKVNIKKTK